MEQDSIPCPFAKVMKTVFVAAALGLSSVLPLAQTPRRQQAPTERPGSVVSADVRTPVMKECSGPTITLSLDEKFAVNEVLLSHSAQSRAAAMSASRRRRAAR
ncbi:MAG: hypothetical protein ABIO45_10300 [Burkholderiaceae bacterium]